MSVELYHWNPVRPIISGPIGHYVPIRRRLNNFGDLLGPAVVRKLLASRGLDHRHAPANGRLLSVGSILHFAEDKDVIWGSGVNGKKLSADYCLDDVDIRAVRGPRTRDFLRGIGVAAPAVFGDPGLLVGRLWSRTVLRRGSARRSIAIVPNLHDWPTFRDDPRAINPRSPLWKVIAGIAASDFVVGSSLHGIIVAESLGIPAQTIRASAEPEFKYHDYFEGTGRTARFAEHVDHAIALGGQDLPLWSENHLVDAFPFELWVPSSRRSVV